jgi:hypothetical protein
MNRESVTVLSCHLTDNHHLLMESEEILILKTEQNARMAFYRLPVELFVKILRDCSWNDLLSIHTTSKGIKELMDQEHAIWSEPPIANTLVPDRIVDLFVKRSGSSSLLSFSTHEGTTPCSSSQLDIILSQLHRTKELAISSIEYTSNLQTFLNTLHGTRADRLEELTLRSHRVPLEILPTLCGGTPHHLITLILSNFYIRGLPEALSLQRLDIHNSQCELQVLRAALLSLKQLRHIRLDEIWLYGTDRVQNEPVELPYLRELQLTVDIIYLSDHMDMLPDPKLHFSVIVSQDDDDPSPSLTAPLLDKTLSRLERFWKSTTGQCAFPEGSSSSRFDSRGRQLDRHFIQLGRPQDCYPSSSGSGVFFSSPVINLLDASPFMSQITELLIILDERMDRPLAIHEDIDFGLFTGAHKLSIKDIITGYYHDGSSYEPPTWNERHAVLEIYDWILQRYIGGSPITCVVFQEAPGYLRPFYEHLRHDPAVKEVIWEEKEREGSDTEFSPGGLNNLD